MLNTSCSDLLRSMLRHILLRLSLYSPYAQACKHFFLAETIDEAIGRFDNAKRAEAAVV